MHGDGIGFKPSINKTSWSKGLTKETSESVRKVSEQIKLQNPYRDTIDDDGKIYMRWQNKRTNAKKEGVDFNLSFNEYCQLVFEAGLKSSQLGFTGEKYVLGRYRDTGAYEIGNCRFITQLENSHEKRNYKGDRYCLKCGKKLDRHTKGDYCIHCCDKTSTFGHKNVVWPTKEVLKQKIQEESFVQIGKDFGVSDTAVRKWCKHYELPYKAKDIKAMTKAQ